MRRFIVKDKPYALTEKQYAKLLRRFDIKRAHKIPYGRLEISTGCICPGGDTFSCRWCPLGAGKSWNNRPNCLRLMSKAASSYFPRGLALWAGYLTYPPNSKAIPKFLTKIREALLTIPRTDR